MLQLGSCGEPAKQPAKSDLLFATQLMLLAIFADVPNLGDGVLRKLFGFDMLHLAPPSSGRPDYATKV